MEESYAEQLANIAAYIGMGLAIIGIRASEGAQRVLFFLGPLLLLFGAIGLKNEVLIASQAVIGLAGMLGFIYAPKKLSAALTVLAGIASFYFLYYSGLLGLDWSLVGAFGFFTLALGIAASPRKLGSGLFVLGGTLMFAYSWAFWAVPWIILNIPFTLVALSALFKKAKK